MDLKKIHKCRVYSNLQLDITPLNGIHIKPFYKNSLVNIGFRIKKNMYNYCNKTKFYF